MISVRKPLLTLIVSLIVISAIVLIELQKPDISSAKRKNDSEYQKASDFTGIESWINSEPLSIDGLKGKVVLVDFWTYTCINCIRTLPYLKEWDEKYRDKGLIIVGVHTPEFQFEKKYENVLKAVNDNEIKYPVALDNSYATWRAYQNRYWPHKYLIDAEGNIRYDHIGEGNYEETEKMIQKLLMEKNDKLKLSETITKPEEAADVDFSKIRTPEIYFGYDFSRGNFGNEEGIKAEQIIDYKISASIVPNNVYLEGKWKNNADNMELIGDKGNILLVYNAKSINIVSGSDNISELSAYLDYRFLAKQSITEFKLYNLANTDYKPHLINISVSGKGFRIYTFTFG